MKEHSLVLMQQFLIITNSCIWNKLELPHIWSHESRHDHPALLLGCACIPHDNSDDQAIKWSTQPSFCDCPTGIQQFMHTRSGLIRSCLLVQVQIKLDFSINTITIQSSPWSTISLGFEYWKSFFTDAIIWSNSQLLLLWTGSSCGLGFLTSGVQCANLYDYRLVLTTTTHLGICQNASTLSLTESVSVLTVRFIVTKLVKVPDRG